MKNIVEILGQNVKRIRKERGMTQETLSERTGLSVIFIQNIEAGRRWVGPETVSTLAKALNVSEATVFCDPDERPKPEALDILIAVSGALGIDIPQQALKKFTVRGGRTTDHGLDCPKDVLDDLFKMSRDPRWQWDGVRVALRSFVSAFENEGKES